MIKLLASIADMLRISIFCWQCENHVQNTPIDGYLNICVGLYFMIIWILLLQKKDVIKFALAHLNILSTLFPLYWSTSIVFCLLIDLFVILFVISRYKVLTLRNHFPAVCLSICKSITLFMYQDTEKTLRYRIMKLYIIVTYEKRMKPIHLQGHRSRSWEGNNNCPSHFLISKYGGKTLWHRIMKLCIIVIL